MTDQNYSAPIDKRERIVTLDIIRGVAILGILIMNIQAFSMIFSAYVNPTAYGDLNGANFWVYYLGHLFADQKFMTIFAMLFGAGIVLLANNVESKGGNSARVHYKRMFFLAIFGLIHALVFWFGDILLGYAIGGAIAYLMYEKSPRFLIITGTILISFMALLMWSFSFIIPMMEGPELQEMQNFWAPSAETIANEIASVQSSWVDATEYRNTMFGHAVGNILFYEFRIIGLMAIGMALFKMNFFGDRYSSKSLISLGLVLFALGTGLTAYGAHLNFAAEFPLTSMISAGLYNYWGSIFSAIAYMAFLIVLCRSSLLMQVKGILANVGKMALTNYLMQTLICCFIFHGWGLGYFGEVSRVGQASIVVGVWVILISFTMYWMKGHQFGPMEWVLRRLTYGKKKAKPIEKAA